MNSDYTMHEDWENSIEDNIIGFCHYKITHVKNNMFDLESEDNPEMMPKIHVELDRQDGKIYFSPELYAPALIYDDMNYPDSYEYWVEKWLKAARLCKLLTSAVLE